jgi:4-amino-4-deoxy-L-arabinose transferase-like glycosyltransferase
MLLLLIPCAVFVLFLSFAGSDSAPEPFRLRKAFLKTCLTIGVFIALVTEILSLFHLLTRMPVVLAWVLLIVGVGWFGLRGGRVKTGFITFFKSLKQIQRSEALLALALGVLVSLLLVIIIYAPINNTDSLQYHLGRVVHWAQNRSLAHYATNYEPQLIHPVWAEEAILHIRLLWGDDRFAELVQWSAMLGCMLIVSLIAGLLGAGRKGQIAAALFSASAPLGILEATSAQNDYVAAFWLVCLLAAALLCYQEESFIFYLACALGLGLLTKGTFYPYALPVMLWLGSLLLRRVKWSRLLRHFLLTAGLVLVLNAGYWARNWLTFGGPLGYGAYVGRMASLSVSPGFIAASVARNVAMNFVTPSALVNERMHAGLVGVFGKYDPNLAGFQFTWGWNHEDLAANPLHFAMVPLCFAILLILRKRFQNPLVWEYILVSLAIFVALSFIIKIDQYGIRFQLPFIISWAPVFGLALEALRSRRIYWAVMIFLLVLMLPWVFYNRTRSLIAMQDTPGPFTIPCNWHLGCGVRSVLVEPPATILFTNFTPYRDGYLQMADLIKSSGCRKIGLVLDSWDSEYLFWWLLDAPQSGWRIETLYTTPILEKYQDKTFEPCAVICKLCSGQTEYRGLPLKSDYAGAALYMEDRSLPAP